MPVNILNNSFVSQTPLSSFWTHKSIASEVMVLTNTIDNEKVQLENIRHHINSAIAYLANLLNLATSPWYGVWFEFTAESSLHPSGLEYCDLAGDGIITANIGNKLHAVKRVNIQPEADAASDAFVGNCARMDIAQLTQLITSQNLQYRHTIAWAHNGNEILLFTGKGIETPLHPERSTYAAFTTDKTHYVGWGYRKPLLDNMVPESIDEGVPFNDEYRGLLSQNYYGYIDLPDEYVSLLIKMVQKNVLEQLREQIPAQLEGEINQGLATITQNITNELQLEAAEREKQRYGNQQRPPGAMA